MSYLERWKAMNRPTCWAPCVHCAEPIEMPLRPERDSILQCPHCDELLFKSIDRAGKVTTHAAPAIF